ncbi:Hypothetical predicted protein [Mytilus galloprovincialis]|uniref:Uncharacterized protein n=1 Tax=Mytilus galloprovincialis TaxID=29158 RepID=A0A8B6DJ20_MYTGA|nr:Hypothetical predicted protein [Mytilus galloprovincialis]
METTADDQVPAAVVDDGDQAELNKQRTQWGTDEQALLTSLVLEDEKTLFGAAKGDGGDGNINAIKRRAWQAIADQLNAFQTKNINPRSIHPKSEVKEAGSTKPDENLNPGDETDELPRKKARDIQRLLLVKNNTEVSLSSVRKAIDAASWVSTAPRYCQLKRDANKEARVKFCQDMIQNNDNFQDVIFSDETTLQLHDNKTGAYRRKESAAPTNCRLKHPLKVNVWGGTIGGKATADIPGRFFKESSLGKGMQYFHDQLCAPQFRERLTKIMADR